MILFDYKIIQEAIEKNDIQELENINLNMKNSFISFKDIIFWKTTDTSYVMGKPFVPPLEQAMFSKCFLAFRYILENGVEPQRSFQPYRNIVSASGKRVISARGKGKGIRVKSGIKHVDNSLERLREKAENLEIYEIIDILDNFGENAEIIAAANARNDLLSAKRYKTVSATFTKIDSALSSANNNNNYNNKVSNRNKNVSTANNKSKKSNICLIL